MQNSPQKLIHATGTGKSAIVQFVVKAYMNKPTGK